MKSVKALALLALTPVLLMPSLARAQLQEVNVHLEGFFCVGCSVGVKMAVKRFDGVKKVDFNAKEGRVRIEPKDGKLLRIDKIQELLAEGGWKSSEASIEIKGDVTTLAALRENPDAESRSVVHAVEAAIEDGRIEMEKGEPLILRLPETDEFVVLMDAAEEFDISSETMTATVGKTVMLAGTLSQHGNVEKDDSIGHLVIVWPTKIDILKTSA